MANTITQEPSVCVIAGEPSGDLLAAAVVRDLRRLISSLRIWGMTGAALRESGVETIYPMERQSVMGFTQVLRRLPTVLGALREVSKTILERSPDIVLLVDYPGFNLRLASRLRKGGYGGKIIQMVSPSVWAHSPGRITSMARNLDLLLTIFPFEAEYFEHSGLRTVYIGNPIAERVRAVHLEPPPLVAALAVHHPIIGLFPGSRAQDLESHVPVMLQAARDLLHHYPEVRLILSCAHERLPILLHRLCQPKDGIILGENLLLIDQKYNLGVMRYLTAAIAKSGTMTLELGLSKVPTVCCYAISFINAAIVKLILRVKLPFYCIVNILRKKEVFPEKVYRNFTAKNLVDSIKPFLASTEIRKSCVQELDLLCKQLEEPAHPSEQAALEIAQLLTKQTRSNS